ncbi:hypothetical protein N665_1107s0014 [Sinapis alba]|nr:hypothetical protein N665_1107s0014 [Sinapis alba]
MEEEVRVGLRDQQVSKIFPVKPKSTAKRVSKSETTDSRYWSSFKPHSVPDLVSSVSALAFSPIHPPSFLGRRPLHHRLPLFLPLAFRLPSVSVPTALFSPHATSPVCLRPHKEPARFVKYPFQDKLHLVSGGDDGVVKYWDVAGATVISDLLGHKDYVRCGDCSPVNDSMFVTGSYDHTVKVWDARVDKSKWMAEINHGSPVEDVVYLPSGGMIATAGLNSVKVWDLIGGGRMVCSMESHNKTVTSLCVGRMGFDENRLVSVALDGYMKVFDYGRAKVTFSMRFPAPLISLGLSPDSSLRVIGGSNGMQTSLWSVNSQVEESRRRALRPSYFRYFQRGQSEKPSKEDYLVKERKGVKLTRHDKLLKKFRHKEALVSVLEEKKPANVAAAVMEELVARRKMIKCVSNMEEGELGLLLSFLQRYCTVQRFSVLLMALTKKVLETRAEDINGKEEFKGILRNLKREVNQEIKIQQSLLEIQGVIAPLMRIAC